MLRSEVLGELLLEGLHLGPKMNRPDSTTRAIAASASGRTSRSSAVSNRGLPPPFTLPCQPPAKDGRYLSQRRDALYTASLTQPVVDFATTGWVNEAV